MFSQNESFNQNNYPNVVYLLLAAKPWSFSKALVEKSASLCKGDSYADAHEVFTKVLHRIVKEKHANGYCIAPPTFLLQPEVAEEYNPCFIHLRQGERQHAMEVVSRSQRRAAQGTDRHRRRMYVLVALPLPAHPRLTLC